MTSRRVENDKAGGKAGGLSVVGGGRFEAVERRKRGAAPGGQSRTTVVGLAFRCLVGIHPLLPIYKQ